MRLAARMGPAGTSCLSRRSSIRRTSVGWLGTRMNGPRGLPVSRRYTGKGPKNQTCEEKNWHPARPIASTEVLLWTCAAVRCDEFPHFQSCKSDSSEKYDPRAGCMRAKEGQRSDRGPEKARGGQARRALRVRSPPDPEQHGPTWNTPARHSRLTGVEPDLDRAVCCWVEGRVRPMPEPQALQQPLRHVLQRAEQLHRRSLALLAGQVP